MLQAIFVGTGRDPSRHVLVVRGLLALAVIVALVGLLVVTGRGAFADETRAVVRLDSAGGSLTPGTDVKFHGLIVGEVAGINLGESKQVGQRDAVDVTVRLDRSHADSIPRDVRARVLPATVFGTSFVDLVGDGGARGVQSDQIIAQDRRASTLELQSVLNSVDRVVDALGPAELSATLEALATGLDGNGARLGKTFEQLRSYLAKLNPEVPRIRRNLRLLATNLEAFEKYAPDVFDAVDDALVVARTLVDSEDDFAGLVRNGAAAFESTDQTLSANQQQLEAVLVRLSIVTDVLYDGRKGLVNGLLALGRFSAAFSTSLRQGNYARIDGALNLGKEPKYGPEDCPDYGGHRGGGC